MYVTPDLSGVEIKILGAAAQALGAEIEILGAAAQPLGAKIEIIGVAAQQLAWRRAVAHKEGNSWSCACTYGCAARCVLAQYPKLLINELLCYSKKVSD